LTVGKTIETSNPEHGMVFARIAPQPSLYTLRADFLDVLEKSLAAFTAE
jgi:hypothetical protein